VRCDNFADTTLPGVRSTSETTGPVDPEPTCAIVTVVPDQLPAVTVEPQAVTVEPQAVIVQPPTVTVEPFAVTDQPAAGGTSSMKHIILMHLFVGGFLTASAPQANIHVSQFTTTSF